MNLVLFTVILITIGVFHYNNSYAQEVNPEDFISPEIRSPDFNSPDDNFSPNARIIAQEIILYNETEIKDYPFIYLPSEELKAVFNILDSGNLTKVLLNIPVNDIQEIQNKLSEEQFNNILNRLLPNERSILIKNLNFTSYR